MPIALDGGFGSDLILIEGKRVFEFAEASLDTPTARVGGDDGMRRERGVVGDKDMVRSIVILVPLTEHDDDVDGDGAILQCGLKRVSPAAVG